MDVAVQTKPVTWAYSTLKLFELCPRKYQQIKILHNVKEEQKAQQLYGDRFHKAAEARTQQNVPIPEEFEKMKPVVERLMAIPGQKHAELRMAVDAHLNPCSFRSPDAWARAIADLVIEQKEKRQVLVCDYKTGKDRYPDKDQLEILALICFQWFPFADSVKSSLLYVVRGSLISFTMTRSQAPQFWQRYRERAARLQAAYSDDVWNATPNFSCHGWCPITACEHYSAPRVRK